MVCHRRGTGSHPSLHCGPRSYRLFGRTPTPSNAAGRCRTRNRGRHPTNPKTRYCSFDVRSRGSRMNQPDVTMNNGQSFGALHGVRVLDLTQALAGPFCTSLLGDQGAEIIKIEALSGDMMRYVGPFADDAETQDFGNVFQNANRNKRSLALDLKSSEGQQVLLRLVETADVLVENFSQDRKSTRLNSSH